MDVSEITLESSVVVAVDYVMKLGNRGPCSLLIGPSIPAKTKRPSGPRRVRSLTSGLKDPWQEDMVSLANLTSVE
jgi:hypothetical protein